LELKNLGSVLDYKKEIEKRKQKYEKQQEDLLAPPQFDFSKIPIYDEFNLSEPNSSLFK